MNRHGLLWSVAFAFNTGSIHLGTGGQLWSGQLRCISPLSGFCSWWRTNMQQLGTGISGLRMMIHLTVNWIKYPCTVCTYEYCLETFHVSFPFNQYIVLTGYSGTRQGCGARCESAQSVSSWNWCCKEETLNKGLSDFDKNQTAMSGWPNISKTAGFVWDFQCAMVRTYQKRSKEDQPM